MRHMDIHGGALQANCHQMVLEHVCWQAVVGGTRSVIDC